MHSSLTNSFLLRILYFIFVLLIYRAVLIVLNLNSFNSHINCTEQPHIGFVLSVTFLTFACPPQFSLFTYAEILSRLCSWFARSCGLFEICEIKFYFCCIFQLHNSYYYYYYYLLFFFICGINRHYSNKCIQVKYLSFRTHNLQRSLFCPLC